MSNPPRHHQTMHPIVAVPLTAERVLTIESADDLAVRRSASRLIARRYAWRGYGRFGLQAASPAHRTTLAARSGDSTLGTMTVVLDSDEGLAAEAGFAYEVRALRQQGRRIAEFTRLAVEPDEASERVLAALFHVGHALAHLVHSCDLLLVEVNPRHVRYYARLLGARVLAEADRHSSVDAPAVLLGIELGEVQSRIAQASSPRPRRRGTLFAWAFGAEQETRVVGALKAMSAALWPSRPAAAA